MLRSVASDVAARDLAASLASAGRARSAIGSWSIASGGSGSGPVSLALTLTLSPRLSGALARARSRPRAGAAEPPPQPGGRLALGLTRRPVHALALAVSIRIEPPTRGAEGEVRRLTLRCLSLGARQRCPNQRAMDRPLISVGWRTGVRFRFVGDVGLCAIRLPVGELDRLLLACGRRTVSGVIRRFEHWFGARRNATRTAVDEDALSGLAAARSRQLAFPVFVVRVTRGAARLLHLVLEHRDDRMIGDAALARTVVVENV